MWTPAKSQVLSTIKWNFNLRFLLFYDSRLNGEIGSYSIDDTKVIFLRGKPKNTGN